MHFEFLALLLGGGWCILVEREQKGDSSEARGLFRCEGGEWLTAYGGVTGSQAMQNTKEEYLIIQQALLKFKRYWTSSWTTSSIKSLTKIEAHKFSS